MMKIFFHFKMADVDNEALGRRIGTSTSFWFFLFSTIGRIIWMLTHIDIGTDDGEKRV